MCCHRSLFAHRRSNPIANSAFAGAALSRRDSLMRRRLGPKQLLSSKALRLKCGFNNPAQALPALWR